MEPQSIEQFENSSWFKRGADDARAKKTRKQANQTAAILRFGCWQQEAYLAGYDSIKGKVKE